MKFLIIDDGLFATHAQNLAEKGKNTVYYKVAWESKEANIHDNAPGTGLEYLTKIDSISPVIKDVDCIISFDVMFGDTLSMLKSLMPGKSYFGSGLRGEKLEHDRWWLKKLMKSLNLPLNKCAKVKGIEALRNYLKENKNKFIKIDKYKRNLESFLAKDLDRVKGKLINLESDLGVVFSQTTDFIVEDEIPADVEIGADLIFDGENFLKPMLWGAELHKVGYIGKLDSSIPAPLWETMEKLKPVLKKMGYVGMISTEERIKTLKDHYLIDVCSRGALPLTIGYGFWYKNWPEIVYNVGLRKPIKINSPYKYVSAFPLKSSENENEYLRVDIKPGHEDRIKLWLPCRHNGINYSCKGSEFACVIIGYGNTPDEAIQSIEKEAEFVEADGLEKDFENLHKIKKQIKACKRMGIDF